MMMGWVYGKALYKWPCKRVPLSGILFVLNFWPLFFMFNHAKICRLILRVRGVFTVFLAFYFVEDMGVISSSHVYGPNHGREAMYSMDEWNGLWNHGTSL